MILLTKSYIPPVSLMVRALPIQAVQLVFLQESTDLSLSHTQQPFRLQAPRCPARSMVSSSTLVRMSRVHQQARTSPRPTSPSHRYTLLPLLTARVSSRSADRCASCDSSHRSDPCPRAP